MIAFGVTGEAVNGHSPIGMQLMEMLPLKSTKHPVVVGPSLTMHLVAK
jgi:hypothetical protein